MGRKAVKQKNGLYAIWCNTADCYLYKNQTREEVKDILINEERKIIRFNIEKQVQKAKHDPVEMEINLELIACNHGEDSSTYKFAQTIN